MKLLIDTNIILDFLLEREPFYNNSKEILNLCALKKFQGFITASSVTDIFYIVHKALKNIDETYKILAAILNILEILSVTGNDIQKAFIRKAKDFEDCLMAECAKSNKCDGIVTRNYKDFQDFNIKIYTPENIIEKFKS